ncbi:MAG: DUF2959 domain-containing protein [Phycisphaerales bacterium]|nr:DUF2959 domain-containing protein [Phycisphaerales bacterium]
MRRGSCGRWSAVVIAGLAVHGVWAVGGCSSTRIAMAEQFGYAKREQLVDRVEEARDGQVEAKKQFESALAEFLAVTDEKGTLGDLEARYDRLKSAYARSETKAEAVTDRIDRVEAVAAALFKEWNAELKQYSSDALRSASERQLRETRARYDRLVGAMRAAEGKMKPVLAAFNDQVLYLKHNLNARAIAALQGTAGEIERDVGGLIREMEASIAEANTFIEQMEAAEKS